MKNILLILILFITDTIKAQQKITYIKLSRTDCKGKCTVYNVELSHDGSVTWHGISKVSKKGFYTAQISKKEMRVLFAEFEKNNFTKLRKQYNRVAGKSNFNFEIEVAGKILSIENAEGGPEFLRRMAASIDQKTKNLKWRQVRFTPPVIIDKEIDPPPVQDIDVATIGSSEMNGEEGYPIYEQEIKAQENDILTFAEEMPEFPGGMEALGQFMRANVKYPEMAREMGVSGKVYCRFVIDELGNVHDVKVLKGVVPTLDQEAMRVIRMMPRWIPGKMHKKPVKVQYTLPVNFVLR